MRGSRGGLGRCARESRRQRLERGEQAQQEREREREREREHHRAVARARLLWWRNPSRLRANPPFSPPTHLRLPTYSAFQPRDSLIMVRFFEEPRLPAPYPALYPAIQKQPSASEHDEHDEHRAELAGSSLSLLATGLRVSASRSTRRIREARVCHTAPHDACVKRRALQARVRFSSTKRLLQRDVADACPAILSLCLTRSISDLIYAAD